MKRHKVIRHLRWRENLFGLKSVCAFQDCVGGTESYREGDGDSVSEKEERGCVGVKAGEDT